MSMYKVDYHVKDRANVHGQKFVSRPQTSFDCGRPLTTMYRYSHGAENPNQATLNELNNINRQVAPTHKRETNTDTVASCMSWHWPCPPRRERLIPYNQQSAPYDTDLPRTPPPTAPPSPRPPPCTNIIAAWRREPLGRLLQKWKALHEVMQHQCIYFEKAPMARVTLIRYSQYEYDNNLYFTMIFLHSYNWHIFSSWRLKFLKNISIKLYRGFAIIVWITFVGVQT